MSTLTYDAAHARLAAIGQEHALRFYKELSPTEQRSLLEQVASLDVKALPRLIEKYVLHAPRFELPPNLRPAPYFAAASSSWDRDEFKRIGERLLRAGKIAAFTVAGGQGSRLGYEGPKGCFPAGAVSNKPLFQIFADALWKASRKYGAPVPWYIMTSPLNHAATVAFFEEHRYFDLNPADVRFFPQGVMPSLDIKTGKVLLAAKGEIATNPDGHGGALRALWESGAVADMQRRGVEHISYFQVDNPIVKVVDPVFLGLHAAAPNSSREMSSKMIPKAYPEEKLGVFCRVGDRTEVIEYSDLPKSLAQEKLPDGTLRFNAGSIAVHVLGVAFVERLNTDAAFELPYHRAEKKVACINPETGAPVEPKENNAVKLERFVFDALALCRPVKGEPGSIVYETDRTEEFAPIKNAAGVDSPDSSRDIQTERAARWLATVGAKAPRRADSTVDAVLEINPRTAIDPEDLVGVSVTPIASGERRVV